MRSTTTPGVAVLLLSLALLTPATAQHRAPLTPADYGQFESLALPPGAGLSPDGRWLAYGINRSNRHNELRLQKIGDGLPTVIPFATQPAFSSDSKWAAYAIGMPEAEEERLRKQRKPLHRKLGLMSLETREVAAIDGIQSFAFNASGTHLAMRRYPPERPANAPAPDPDDPAPGATLIVRELATGRDTTFGNVAEYAWQDVSSRDAWGRGGSGGGLLALVISTEDRTANGVHLFDVRTTVLRVLDSAPDVYAGLSWRQDSSDLAVLRGATHPKREGRGHTALAWTGLGGANPSRHLLDPAASAALPAGMRLVSARRPSWSHDGRTLYLGVAEWRETIAGAGGSGEEAPDEEEPPTVEVWHARDVEVMARQKVSARADRQRSLLAAWHLEEHALVTLGRDRFEQVTPIARQRLALAAQWSPYAMERTIGRPAADLFLVDTTTGARTPLVDAVDDRYAQPSPGGRYILYFHADHYWTIDTRTRTVTNVTRSVPATFVNRESDVTVRQKPPFGVAGWTKDDGALLLYDKFDVWQVAPDGSGAARLTSGAADQVRHRYVRLDRDEDWIDPDRPMYVSLFGVWTKQSGYGRVTPGAGSAERLVWLDKGVSALGRASRADVFAYVVQAFDDSPDVFVGGPSLASATQVTTTNPFQSKYAWGRSEVVDYRTARGERLQGALHYPAGYEPGRKYPMVVYLYERLSDGVHRYVPPSERDYYNASVFTSGGYVFFQPDITFRPRDPGLSVLECVEPAVKKVVAMGVADPGRVGVVGHSWGGFDAAYLATHSTLFAAAVAGAPIVNLVSNYGNHHWSSGIAETDHIETGQQRMEVPLWEDLPAYLRNSAVFNVHRMQTPLLIEVGDADGTVFWHQGIELYNIARRAKKQVVLLNYAGEDHGLRKKANQIDYQRRIVQWFGHYLKGEPASPWIVRGTSFLEREDELRRAKGKRSSGS
jgi:dipeptidyl aminopeptidase/acylaminoacyl peptidase